MELSGLNKHKTKAQSSLEYLLVVALTFVIIIPTTYLFYNYSKESTQEIKDSQVTKIGSTIIDTAKFIYYSGEGSKTELELNVPDNVNSVDIFDGRELVFNIRTEFGDSDIVFFSNIPIKKADVDRFNKLAESGLKKVKIEAIKEASRGIITIDVV